jgi:cyclohexanone monooxygenase
MSGRPLDIVIVGAGFSGLYMLHQARELGFSACILERGADVGGTWYWNRYPGARCDVESTQYCYAFSEELQRDWTWTERFSAQPEILAYARFVADRLDLRRDIAFGCAVVSASFDDRVNLWTVATADGRRFAARFLVMATGPLSNATLPRITGLEDFDGTVLQTSAWPAQGVDLAGRRVAVIGTGSTGIQLIPEVAARTSKLYVLQRTPNYSVPARNRPLDRETADEWKRSFREKRALAKTRPSGTIYRLNDRSALSVDSDERERVFEDRWQYGGAGMVVAFNDLTRDEKANETIAAFVRGKIAQTVANPQVAAALTPTDYPLGAKRICLDTGYFQTFNRDNVELVDLRRRPIRLVDRTGIRVGDDHLDVDVIIFATGFDALTGALNAIDITGPDGRTLRDKWAAGPRTWLGLMAAGFPNLFIVAGPGSPSVLTNFFVSIEQHVEWIAACIDAMRANGHTRIEADAAAEDGWVDHVNEVASRTLYIKAASWYLGANVPGKPRIFMPYAGGVPAYFALCDEVAADGYRGFTLS